MNGPFVVAQANVAGAAAAVKKPVRIVKVTKPSDGQAITVDLGYEQQTKLDLTAVANEKMTLVHIGEKLIILFDNNSTVTVEPFFDSMGVPRQDLTIGVPGRDMSSSEFASVFPITTDPSVLPAAGDNARPASGANFSNASVDPLLSPDPLPLLGPEELPNWQVHFETVPLREVVLPLVEDEPPPLVDGFPDAVVIDTTAAAIVLDESPVAPGGDGIVSATADFSVNFSAANFGTDGAGGVAYSLVLTGSNVASGLFALDPADTSAVDGDGIGQGAQIVLNQSGNVITGSIGAITYFTIQINPATGVVTFTRVANIWHGDASNHDDRETLTLSDPTLLRLVQTVTDADGDTDTAALDLGAGVFTIEDDGPNAVVVINAPDTLVLDESPTGQDEGGDFAPAGLNSVTANFADNFGLVPNFGTDGASSAKYTLVLTGAGVASGLFALGVNGAQGASIVLNKVGNDILGQVGAVTYFTISVAGNGMVTFTQSLNIWHANTASDDDTATLTLSDPAVLQLTVTDADGDVDTAAINLGTGVFQIEDDGPDAVVANATVAAIVLDETRPVGTETDGDSAPAGLDTVTVNLAGNFAAVTDFGSDGPGSATYSLVLTGSNVASGLFALGVNGAQGASIVLNQSGNTITGSAGGTNYFTITLNPATGQVTFTQLNNIWHASTASDDDTATLTLANANLLTLVQTVTDADGDVDAAAINLGTGVFQIEDDGPDAVVANAVAAAIVLDETRPVGTETDGDSAPAGLDTVTVNLAGNFAAVTDFGSDGPGSATYSLVLTGSNVASGLFALDAADTTLADLDGIGQGAQIVLNQSGNTITGSAGGTNYFTITLNPATGQVTFTQLNNIWHASTASDDDTATLTLANANLLTLVQTVTDADGDVDAAAINLGTGVFQIEDDGPDAVVANATVAAIVLDETRPVGTETDGDSAPAGLDTVTVNLAGNFAAVTDFGSDGPGSATYSLVLTGSNVASGLFALGVNGAQGASIVLNQSGNTITGSAGGTNYFTITLNPATGQVTFTQLNNIWHASTASDDDTATLTLANANLLTLVQTVTDADGDVDAAAINLGTGVFQIEDDGPDAVVANATVAAIVLDETRPVGTETDGDSAPAGLDTVTVNLAGNFAAVTDFGSDGPGSATYSLVLTGSNVASGLFALGVNGAQGASIVLNQSGNTITGSAGGTNYFTITLNPATGQVTFTQLNNIWHASTASDDDTATLTLANANLLTLVQTVTDADGDVDAAAINLGTGVFQIEDDGPDAVVANATVAAIVLDETRPVGTETDGDSAPAGLDTVTVNLAGNFAAVTDFGSDGPGSATYSLVLTGSNVASGLFALDAADTTAGDLDGIGQGAQIVLNQSGNTITGSAGGTNYFTITLNPATGQVTFTQLNNIWHASTASDDDTATLTLANANLLTLVQTVTDADGDVDTAAINLGTGVFQIEDDGPDAVVANAVAAAIVLDETRPVGTETDGDSAPAGLDTVTVNLAGNFAAVTDFGSDGPGSATYSLVLTGSNVASGLFALGVNGAQGASIVLNQSGNTITGSAGGTNYFTITLNPATGQVTFTQLNNIWHASTASDDDTATLTLANANLLTLVQTVTDADGDVDAAAINLGTGVFQIEDDGPTAILPDHAVVTNNGAGPGPLPLPTFELDQDGTLADNFGADNEGGTVRFPSSLDGSPSGLTSGGAAIIYHVSNNGLTLTGTANGNDIFVLVLNPTTASYTVDMIGTVDVTTEINFSSGGYDFAGGNTEWNGFIPTTESLGGGELNNNSPDILLTPELGAQPGVPGGAIQTNANEGGVVGGGAGANVVEASETFRVDFVTDLSGDPHSVGPGNYGLLAKRDHVFDGHYTVNGSSAFFTSSTGGAVRIAAFDDPDGNNVVGDGVIDALTLVAISINGVTQTFNLAPAGQQTYLTVIGGFNFGVSENPDGTVIIDGVRTGTEISIFTANGYNSVEYSYVSGSGFSIGQFGASVPTTGSVSFDVPIELVDGDGDTVADSIGVTLTPPGQVIQDFSLSGVGVTPVIGAANPHVIGSEFNDTLNGDLSPNTLFGNAGNDIISGGAGNDVLIGGAGNDTLTGGTGLDRMIFEEVGAANQDIINSYAGTGADRDIIDLSGLLDANFGVGSVESNFVRLQDAGGGNLNVQVDTDGLANGVNFATVATLTSYNTIGNIVTTYFEGAEHQLTVT